MESTLKNSQRFAWPMADRSAAPDGDLGNKAGIRRALYRLFHWETWDWRIKYCFIAPAWCWFCIRARSPWFFTASNPSLTFGGFDGESKKEMYEQLPPGTYPKSIYASPHMCLHEVEEHIAVHRFKYPFVVKPNVGKMGFMFRKINTALELEAYHARIHCDYIIQELIEYPVEVSVFYYRYPHAQKGAITGFIRKEFLRVTGDGKSTLWELIMNYPRVQFRLDEMKAKHKDKLGLVLAQGQDYCLSPALNLSRGGKLVSLEHEKDDRLLNVFDGLSHYTGNFYYGRYDIKCKSVEDLKQGTNFSILEYNGSGAEPHHVYGSGYSLWQACGVLVSHWRMLYRISKINHEKGVAYWDHKRARKFLYKTRRHLKKLKELDKQTPLT